MGLAYFIGESDYTYVGRLTQLSVDSLTLAAVVSFRSYPPEESGLRDKIRGIYQTEGIYREPSRTFPLRNGAHERVTLLDA